VGPRAGLDEMEKCSVDTGVKKPKREGGSLQPPSHWFLARGFVYPEDGGDSFLRNVGSHNMYITPHPRRRHSSVYNIFTFYILLHECIYTICTIFPPCPLNQSQCCLSLTVSLILRPTVSRSVYLGIKHPTGAYDQIFITVRQLRIC
jgi:hypothetical protein